MVHPTNENPHRETIKIYLLHGFLRRNANAFRTHKTEKKKTGKTPCKLIRPHNHPLPAKMQKRHGHTKKKKKLLPKNRMFFAKMHESPHTKERKMREWETVSWH